MCERYESGVHDYSGLEDELLCEYVDGTMDPLIREVFEEYLRLNPEMKEHVECLRRTRKLLCHFGCRCRAPRDLHERLRREISCELMRAKVPFHLVLSDRLRSFATVTSTMAFLVLVAMIAGVTVFEGDRPTTSVVGQADIFRLGQSWHPRVDRPAIPIEYRASYSRLSTLAPLTTLRSIATSEARAGIVRTDSSVASLRRASAAP